MQDLLILDGGLATELELRGHDLNHPLWSARLMLDDPDAIKAVHRSYLEAGADFIITASYQLSYAGCAALGIGENRTTELLLDTVRIAKESIREFCSSRSVSVAPKVLASIGPYGAFLADGSEYVGQYGLSEEELLDFHKQRFDVLASSDADLLVFETIPSFAETRVLLKLLKTFPKRRAWFSFSCRDENQINDGTEISLCASLLASEDQVDAIGVNCTAPQFVDGLIKQIRRVAPEKAVLAYPNSGETYDANSGSWHGNGRSAHDLATVWYASGARIIGGCCRTTPAHIEQLRKVRGS
ncbi:MAG: homocysteine S-methyltransferase [Pyrinomonadaceae bacterium]|nr:homocysteine S-methyltransferase [Pyrinomonadaceae bacterium]